MSTAETGQRSRLRDTWVDHLGYVHEKKPFTIDRISRCGLVMGTDNPAPPARACQRCVADVLKDDALEEYALRHDCAAEGCIKLSHVTVCVDQGD